MLIKQKTVQECNTLEGSMTFVQFDTKWSSKFLKWIIKFVIQFSEIKLSKTV